MRAPGRRAPPLRADRAEQHHRRHAPRAGEVGDAGVAADDQRGAGDDGAQLRERRPPGQHGRPVQAGGAGDGVGEGALGGRAGDHDVVPVLAQRRGDGGEPVGGPALGPEGRAGVHDGGAVARPGAQQQVVGVGRHAVGRQQGAPALPLVDAVLGPRRPVPPGPGPPGRGEADAAARAQGVQGAVALRPGAVQVHRDVGRGPGPGDRLRPRRGQQRGADRLGEHLQPGGCGEHEPVLRERPAQGAQGRHGDEQVPQPERAQGQHGGQFHDRGLPGAGPGSRRA